MNQTSHEWLYVRNTLFGTSENVGPISEAEMLKLAVQGKIKRDTLVASPTRTNGGWLPAKSIPGILKALEQGEQVRKEERDRQAEERRQDRERQDAEKRALREQQEKERQLQEKERERQDYELALVRQRTQAEQERRLQEEQARQAVQPPGPFYAPPPQILITQQSVQSVQLMYPPKSRLVYILLALFLGGIGIHNFYAGHTNNGVVQLLMGLFGPLLCLIPNLIVVIWALVEICTVTRDGNGVPFN